MCDVGYICANFSLPRPLCSRLTPDVRDRHRTVVLLITSCAGGRHNMPRPFKFTFDLLTLKAVSESRLTWATSVPF